MTGRVGIVVGLASIAALAAAGPATASEDVVSCGFEAKLAYDPGVTMASGDHSFSSHGGVANCAGRADHETVLGVGWVDLAGTAGTDPPPAGGDSCAIGGGDGTIALDVPDAFAFFDPDPYTNLTGEFEYRHVASVWEAAGSVSGPDGNANLAIVGYEEAAGGGCVTAPKTASTLSGRIIVGGDAPDEAAAAAAPCSNHVSGTRKADRLEGTGDDDMLSGFAGGDRIGAKAGADCLFGGRGADRLRGGRGPDAIHCGGGVDKVIARAADTVARNCEKVRRR